MAPALRTAGRKFRLFAGLAAAALAGCGGTASQTTSATALVDITGSWEGTLRQHTSAIFAVVLRVNQAKGGTTVEGTYLTDFGGTGNLSGAMAGEVFRFSGVVTNPGCPGQLSGTGTVDAAASPPRMAIAYSGETCGGPESGEGVLVLARATAPR